MNCGLSKQWLTNGGYASSELPFTPKTVGVDGDNTTYNCDHKRGSNEN